MALETSPSDTEPLRAPLPAPAGRRPLVARLRGQRTVLLSAAVFAALLTLWWLVTATGWVRELFLPGPGAVATGLYDAAAAGQLWSDIGVSTYRILCGFALATAMAVPLGVLAGRYRIWRALIEPVVDFVRYMPVVAFVPLTILWVGTGDSQKFLIVWIGTFFQQVLLFQDDVKRVPRDFVDTGRTLGLSEPKLLWRIVVPSAGPAMWDSVRISLGWAWTWLVLAELVAATSGLGYRITTAQRFFETETIIGYILVLGTLGLITDQVMKATGRRLFRYAEVGR